VPLSSILKFPLVLTCHRGYCLVSFPPPYSRDVPLGFPPAGPRCVVILSCVLLILHHQVFGFFGNVEAFPPPICRKFVKNPCSLPGFPHPLAYDFVDTFHILLAFGLIWSIESTLATLILLLFPLLPSRRDYFPLPYTTKMLTAFPALCLSCVFPLSPRKRIGVQAVVHSDDLLFSALSRARVPL